MVGSSVEEDEKLYKIKEFENAPGIHYEKLGTCKLFNDEWRMITFVNMKSHEQKHKLIKTYYGLTVRICGQSKEMQKFCENFLRVSESVLRSIEQHKETLEYLVGHNSTKNRYKRGLVNAIGRVSKLIFGTLDDEDADYYNSRISQFTKNEQNLAQIIREQSHVIQTTISNFNSTISNLNNNEKVLKGNLDKLIEYVNKESANLTILETQTILNEHFSVFNMIYSQYRQENQAILDCVISAQAGQLHPYIMSPQKLISELQKISTYKQVNFPIMPTLENAHELIKVISLDAFYKSDNLVFVLSIPLVEILEFNIYKLTPLPVPSRKNDFKYVFIQPHAKYLAINDVKQRYITFNDVQYAKCIKMNSELFICRQEQPINFVHHAEVCEVKLFHAVDTVPNNCDKRSIQLKQGVWHRLELVNVWIYVLPFNQKITINCNENVETVLIEGTGSLYLSENCKAFTETTLLTPRKGYEQTTSKLDSIQFIPNVNIAIDCCEEENEKQKKKEDILFHSDNNFRTFNLHLDDLHVASKKLEELDENLDSINWLPTTLVSGSGILTYLFLICLIICIIFCCCFCCPRCTPYRRHCSDVIPNVCIRIRQNFDNSHEREREPVVYSSGRVKIEPALGLTSLPSTSCTSRTRQITGRRCLKDLSIANSDKSF